MIGNFFRFNTCQGMWSGGCKKAEYETEIAENKFYFAFESKNCSNTYITEKFFRTLRHNIIPVVFQPNREFYEVFAPPDSFIHAQDFDFDAKKLAEYLHKVFIFFNLIFHKISIVYLYCLQ